MVVVVDVEVVTSGAAAVVGSPTTGSGDDVVAIASSGGGNVVSPAPTTEHADPTSVARTANAARRRSGANANMAPESTNDSAIRRPYEMSIAFSGVIIS